nr:hypothetical protein [Lachnospiraceae bacterium]
MDVIKIALFGVTAVLLILFLKSNNSQWGTVLSIGASVVLALYMLDFLVNLSKALEEWTAYLSGISQYMNVLWKALGITYLCEFASGVCKDSGNTLIAGQIEMCGKVAVMLLGMPILWALIETITGYYSG